MINSSKAKSKHPLVLGDEIYIKDLDTTEGKLEAEDVDDLYNVCDQLYISVTGDEGLTCYPWKANNGKGNTTSDEGGPVNIYFPDEDDRIPPPSPSSAPDVAGSGYYPKNSTITVSENYDHSTGLAPYFDFYTNL